MKVRIFLCVFLAIFTVVFSAQSLVRKQEGKPGDCWYEDTGPMKKGEVKSIENKCTSASCGNDGTIALTTCGVAVVNGVKVKPDFSKPYPQCCNFP